MLDRIRNFQGADQIDLFGPSHTGVIGRVLAAFYRLGRTLVLH